MRDPLANPRALIKSVYAFAAYALGPGADAEDVTSEALARGIRYKDSFDPKRGDPTAWLIGIARRVIADRALREVPLHQLPELAADGHEIRSIRTLQLAAAVATLEDREREIIALRFGADMKAKEIARVLDMRANTVEVALHRALARLRAELDEGAPNATRPYAPTAPDVS